MGILDLFPRREVRATSIDNPAQDGWNLTAVHKPEAEKLAIVQACVDLIAGSIASLPAEVKCGEELDDTHALNRLIREGANESQSWHAFL